MYCRDDDVDCTQEYDRNRCCATCGALEGERTTRTSAITPSPSTEKPIKRPQFIFEIFFFAYSSLLI